MRGRAAAPDDSRGGRNARWGGPSPDMEPESPNLLARVRWGNVAWALVAVLAVGLAVAWPELRHGAPRLPDGAPAAPRALGPPAPPPVALRPRPAAHAPTPRRSATLVTRSSGPRRPAPHPRAARPRRRGARHLPVAPPAPPPTPGRREVEAGAAPIAPASAAPDAPAGDQEFLPG